MSITIEFLEIAAAIIAVMAICVFSGVAIGKMMRPDDHTKEDDDEQADYLQAVRREAERRRVKAYPITEIKS